MSNPYEVCLIEGHVGNAGALAACLSDLMYDRREESDDTNGSSSSGLTDVAALPFLLFCASLVFFMQAGFAMVCAGSVRKKNVQNTALKNLLDLFGSAISFYCVGYAFAFGGGDADGVTVIGSSNFFLVGLQSDESGLGYCFWFYQFAFAATSGKHS